MNFNNNVSYATQENSTENNLLDERYDTFKGYSKKSRNTYQNEDLPKEVKEDLKELDNITYLKNKTNSNYEIVLAYENHEYTYLDSSDTLEGAIKIAKNKEKELPSNIIPMVINKDGLSVYTTNGIARVVKIIDGKKIEESDKNNYTKYTTPIYRTSTSMYENTTINHGFVDDVPIIEDSGKRVKVEVNGVTGWIDKEDKYGINIIPIPQNQAKNLSYFMKTSNGDLKHYISINVEVEGKGRAIIIGIAPDFMEINKKYYSYDGNYFYTDIDTLIADLDNNNHNNAVNSSQYYNYYTYLPARSKSLYTSKEIDKYIEKYTPSNSVLRNKGKKIVESQE